MSIVRGLIGLSFIFVLGFLVSSNRKKIRFKQMGVMLGLQLIISFLCLHTSGGESMLAGISNFFSWLMSQAEGGVNFVFGGIAITKGSSVFFFNVLMPIVFISALVGILNYIKVLPFIIKWIGIIINKITGMGELESYFSVSTAVLGQPEVFLTIKEQIPRLSPRQLYTICASSMSAVSAAMLASYMSMVDGKFVVVAVFLNIFSALIISCVVNPYDPKEEGFETKEDGVVQKEREPFFQMLGEYILDGFHLAITVAAMLIGFVALVTFLNNVFMYFFGFSFTHVLGYVFSPIAYLIGVPGQDIVEIGGVMATKLITNEFVAMGELAKIAQSLTPKGLAMISTYLISFANFGTLGIISGSIKAIDAKQGKIVAKYSLKLLLGATMASLLTATMVGFFF
ncbi:pyrimidine nucleoside transporter NupC [Companilactobacillus sp. RD055328]|uniref:NupC/NupG family nucleoside CNT transporter n=1 Tax=Companilactobacillus sp. RD055328 TaxID=2916634 RepID=UPI001FC839F6|nr:nucleoside transporter C-terminal domain-containing protein [Companilactobacillus sp. RD055328]GKQ42129.1 pyrimidine nucleoside transporter NupC [Companilactobacillus sp. RD055328]